MSNVINRIIEMIVNSDTLDYFAIGIITFILPIDIIQGIKYRLIELLRTNALVRTYFIEMFLFQK